MSEFTLHPVSDINFEAFTEAFNTAYSDYYVPIRMRSNGFQALMKRDDLVPSASVAALIGDTIIGTGLLGTRGNQGWIGGMGVIPEYRRQGIGRAMMHYLIQQAQARGMICLHLEVIENNTPAVTLYKDLGFQSVRFLHVRERPPSAIPSQIEQNIELLVATGDAADLLTYYEVFHDIPNCWQRSLPSIRALQHQVRGWAVHHHDQVIGYAIGQSSSFSVQFLDIATAPGPNRHDAARTLLKHLHQTYPDAHGTIINLAEDDPTFDAFTALGYITSFRQIEMRLELTH